MLCYRSRSMMKGCTYIGICIYIIVVYSRVMSFKKYTWDCKSLTSFQVVLQTKYDFKLNKGGEIEKVVFKLYCRQTFAIKLQGT